MESPQNLSSEKPTQKPVDKKLLFVVPAVALAVLALFYFYRVSSSVNNGEGNDLLMGQAPEVSPTAYPFQEMTIPSLRERAYSSTLGEKEVLSDNGVYTSYLTSYDSDGFKVNGFLTVPNGQEPKGGWPAIVFIHGYIPPTFYQTDSNYVSYVDYLARNGFVVFKIDLRGHGESEGEPSGAYYSSDYIVDARNAISALEGSGFVNPKKIGLWGHSMAGNVVMRTIASKPDIPAVVIWAGAVYSYEDWQKYGIQDNSYRPPGLSTERQKKRQMLFDTHGEFSPDSPFWKLVAPTNYLKGIKTVIQLNHAVDDDVVNIGYSRDLANLLKAAHTQYELKEYASGGHNLAGGTFNQAMQNTVDFFNINLK